MTSHEFWFGNPQDYFVYQDAFADKERKQHDEIDVIAWRFGYYGMLAYRQVQSEVWGKGHKEIFPDEPISIKSLKEEQKERLDKAHPLIGKFMVMASAVNNKFKEEQNGNE